MIAHNFTKGRGQKLTKIVYHTEGLPNPVNNRPDPSLFNWFNRPTTKASAHFYVKKSGAIEQYVEVGDTAWHAGNWDINQRSVGIEQQDDGKYNDANTYTSAQYESTAKLVAWLIKNHGVSADASNHHPHNQFAQRACPGAFDWGRVLRRAIEINNPPKPDNLYRVHDKNGKQIGAFKVEANAFDKWYSNGRGKVTFQFKDITSKFINMANNLEQKIKELETAHADQVKSLEAKIDDLATRATTIAVENVRLKNELTKLKEANVIDKDSITLSESAMLLLSKLLRAGRR